MMSNQLIGPEGRVLGHRSIDAIGAHDLSVSAQNYEVWLGYFAHGLPDLRAAIDTMISSGKKITTQDMEDLYERFFSTTHLSSQVLETGSRITQEIADALDALKKAASDASYYGETLGIAAQSLASDAIDGEAVKRLVSVLAIATTGMSKQNASLSTKLTQSSLEMENLRQSVRRARAEALTDGLTGVANRKQLDETLRQRIAEAEGEKTELSLILCDIDHFKLFNDKWGHQTGDQVIRFVASALVHFAKPDYTVARYGGEEFAVIMPRTPLKQAGRIADEIRGAIEARRLVRRATSETIGAVTVSFGGTTYALGESANQLVARADECLYMSKRTGRNRVTLKAVGSPAPQSRAA